MQDPVLVGEHRIHRRDLTVVELTEEGRVQFAAFAPFVFAGEFTSGLDDQGCCLVA